jgi:hypothetical protein
MAIRFRRLYTVDVSHAFFGGACDALRFAVPASTQRVLSGMRALARERDGILHLLIETDDAQQPLGTVTGRTLVFALHPREASFEAITVPLGLARGETALWANTADADALDAPRGVQLSPERLRIEPRSGARPLAMRLFDAAGVQHAATTLAAGEDAWSLPGTWPAGEWRVEEDAGGPVLAWSLYVERELAASGAFGLLALTVDAGHVAAGHAFTLAFAARSDTLRYYVVANRFGATEFDQLQVQDDGFAAESRPAIVFDRVLPAAFGPAHLQPALLDPSGSARIALFQAQSAVARRARGPGGIALHRNGDVLIGHLPQPGADRPDAQFVVHLSQP